jgi:hypothetical protein
MVDVVMWRLDCLALRQGRKMCIPARFDIEDYANGRFSQLQNQLAQSRDPC